MATRLTRFLREKGVVALEEDPRGEVDEGKKACPESTRPDRTDHEIGSTCRSAFLVASRHPFAPLRTAAGRCFCMPQDCSMYRDESACATGPSSDHGVVSPVCGPNSSLSVGEDAAIKALLSASLGARLDFGDEWTDGCEDMQRGPPRAGPRSRG